MKVILKDEWAHSDIQIGSYVLVPADLEQNEVVIDRNNNFITVNPDILISVTTISDMFPCRRRAILNEKLKSFSFNNVQMITGRILHSVFQHALSLNRFSVQDLQSFTKEAILMELENIHFTNSNESAIYNAVNEVLPLIAKWNDKYLVGKSHELPWSIKSVHNIEESIWSPLLGLKGNIDATLVVGDASSQCDNMLIPLELKTNRKSDITSYMVQTNLYSTLLAFRQNFERNKMKGLIYFMKQNEMIVTSCNYKDFNSIMMARNELSDYIASGTLPDIVKNKSLCARCHQKYNCELYSRMNVQEKSENNLLLELKESDIEFLKTWDTFLDAEELDSTVNRQEVWNLSGAEREFLGRCYNNMVINTVESINGSDTVLNKFRYEFIRAYPQPLRTSTLMNPGDPIVISRDSRNIGIAKGFIQNISEDCISLILDRKISIKSKNRLKISYRIDKDEMSSGLGNIRFNLFSLFTDVHNRKLKQLIIDLIQPEFEDIQSFNNESLNDEQNFAISLSRAAKDYSLILGMPGTGKTTTISRLIQSFLADRKRILLVAYTHTALDNVLLKCTDVGVQFLRMGNEEKIDPKIRSLRIQKKFETTKDVLEYYSSQNLIATTCHGIRHPLFQTQKFDVCILEEASQVSIPVALGPISCADKFILIGDQYQLPPLSRSLNSRNVESLFQRLSNAHSEAMVKLTKQYRMFSDIMSFSNELIYDLKMQAGLNVDAKNDNFNQSNCWVENYMHSSKDVFVVNTDELTASAEKTSHDGVLIYNVLEGSIIKQIAKVVLAGNFKQNEIGIISPLRSQISFLKEFLKDYSDIEIDSVDRFQGKDKKVIFLSFVRSNESKNTGDLLRDWKRSNVALTRAKEKLFLIISLNTFENDALVGSIIQHGLKLGCAISPNDILSHSCSKCSNDQFL